MEFITFFDQKCVILENENNQASTLPIETAKSEMSECLENRAEKSEEQSLMTDDNDSSNKIANQVLRIFYRAIKRGEYFEKMVTGIHNHLNESNINQVDFFKVLSLEIENLPVTFSDSNNCNDNNKITNVSLLRNNLFYCLYGFCYEFGIGTQFNSKIAFEQFKIAAENNCKYGYFYKNGIACTKDTQKALEWYKKSAEGGNGSGQCSYGYSYSVGQDIPKDYRKAFYWYLKSAANGHSQGKHYLGESYRFGRGNVRDLHASIRWYRSAEDAGNNMASSRLHGLFMRCIIVLQNKELVIELFKKSVVPVGQYNLVAALNNEFGKNEHIDLAFYWYGEAAKTGHRTAKSAEANDPLGAFVFWALLCEW
ncbi:8193_t:CDS:2 [Ambispora gerdemannii]|uniref:8193_t:CDS:1 n=1 Tax=Ambispora gerdemannii TaxID=144530 RepID=A0A9N8VBU7_9GLOM|nr:8193_t:CDS:2 [Ambispora gerdemannii]